MSELLPCPFCGAKPEKVYKSSGQTTHIECPSCHAQFPKSTMENRYDEAWNTRAERTCECVAEYAKSPIDGKTIVLHRCSACHELMRPHMAYCPNCGARVIA